MTRRLTRYEYQNTMRDLLGVDLDVAPGDYAVDAVYRYAGDHEDPDQDREDPDL